MKQVIAFVVGLVLANIVSGQNSCDSALLVENPQEFCQTLSMDMAIEDGAIADCIPEGTSTNIWFRFISDGSDINLSAVHSDGLNTYVSIIHYNFQLCDPAKNIEIACSIDSLDLTDVLEEGTEYYIAVFVEDDQGGDVEVCINNPHDTPPPGNNEACNAYVLEVDSTCILGSTTFAEQSIDSAYCADGFTNDVWYEFTLTNPLAFGADFYLHNVNLQGDVRVLLLEFFYDDCEEEYLVRREYCGSADGFVFNNIGLEQNQRFFLVVSTNEEDQGAFTVCVNQLLAEVNADPCDAIQINPNEECVSFDTYYSLFDFDIIDCNFSNQNLWYKFNTDGGLSSVDLELSKLDDVEEVFFGIGYYPSNFCTNEFMWIDTYCGPVSDALLSADSLKKFQFYHIVIGTNYGFTGEFDMCLNGDYDSPFANDSPCRAYDIDGNLGCIGGSSQYGSEQDSELLCTVLSPTRTNWYKVDLEQHDHEIEVEFSHLSNIPYEKVEVGYFLDGCTDQYIVLNEYCGNESNPILNAVFPDSIPEAHIAITLPDNGVYNYNVCVNRPNIGITCENNDFCQEALQTGTLSVNEEICFSACTFGQTSEDLDNYYLSRYPTTWYEFSTDEKIDIIELKFDNATNPYYYTAIYTGTCASQTLIEEEFHRLNLDPSSIINVEPNQTYLIAVAAINGIGGQVDICLNAVSESACNTRSNLEVISTSLGSPLAGPFKPGETINFCYTQELWNGGNGNCNWLQGIIPIFGDSWSSESFEENGLPLNVSQIEAYNSESEWSWYTDITAGMDNPFRGLDTSNIDYTLFCSNPEACGFSTVKEGDLLPRGWYSYVIEEGNHPTETWGDGDGCGPDQGPWTVCFDLIVGPKEITEDLEIEIYAISDGEIGPNNWSGEACLQDEPQKSLFAIECPFTVNEEIHEVLTCDNITINISLPENLTYYWISEDNANVEGETNLSGKEIPLELNSLSGQIERVQYFVEGYDEAGCLALKNTYLIDVYPELSINREEEFTVCQGESVSMDQVINLSDQVEGMFFVNWESDVLVDLPAAIWTGINDVTIPYTIESQAGCQFSDTVFIHVEDVIISEYLDTFVTCRGDELSFDTVLPLEDLIVPDFTVDWDYGNLEDIPSADTSFETSTNIPFTITGEEGCTFSDTFRVFVPHVPINVLGRSEYCSRDTVSLSAGYIFNEPHTKYWVMPQGDTIFSAGVARRADQFDAGQNVLEFHLFTQEGCPFRVNDTILIYTLPILELSVDTAFLGICPYDSLLLESAVSPSSYDVTWNTPFGQTQESAFYTQESGTYFVQSGIEGNQLACMVRDTFYLEIYPEVETSFEFDPIICDGDSTFITSSVSTYKYVWSTGDFSSEVFVPAGEYAVTVSNDPGCIDAFEFQIEERALPNPGFIYNDEICEGDSTIIEATDSNFEFLWDSEITENSIISFGGNHKVTVTDDEMCIDSFEFSVEVIEYPIPSFDFTVSQDTLYLSNLEADADQCNLLINDEIISPIVDTLLTFPNGFYTIGLTCANGDCAVTVSDTFSVVLVSIEDYTLDQWSIFPNPNNGQFVLDFQNSIHFDQVEILDINGRVLHQFNNESNNQKLSLDLALTSGIYFVKVISGNQQSVKRIVVQK